MFKKKEDEIYNRIYFDETTQEFRTCFETCLTCEKSGNKTYHNCIHVKMDIDLNLKVIQKIIA